LTTKRRNQIRTVPTFNSKRCAQEIARDEQNRNGRRPCADLLHVGVNKVILPFSVLSRPKNIFVNPFWAQNSERPAKGRRFFPVFLQIVVIDGFLPFPTKPH
jgi:hypothetical protein